MSEWFVFRDEKEHGPFSSTDLKAMAKSGGLGKADKIRRSDMQKQVLAGSVKGLFEIQSESKVEENKKDQKNNAALEKEPSNPKTLENSKSVKNSEKNESKWAWKNWTTKGKIILGIFVGFWLIMALVVNVSGRMEANEKFARADSAWSSGDKKAAFAIYEPYIFDKFTFVSSEKLELLISRSLEYCAMVGDSDKFEKIKRFADKESIKIVSENNAVNSLINAIVAKDNAQQQPQRNSKRAVGSNQVQPQYSPKVDALVRFVGILRTLDKFDTVAESKQKEQDLKAILKEFEEIPFSAKNSKDDVKLLCSFRDRELVKYDSESVDLMKAQISIIESKYKLGED